MLKLKLACENRTEARTHLIKCKYKRRSSYTPWLCTLQVEKDTALDLWPHIWPPWPKSWKKQWSSKAESLMVATSNFCPCNLFWSWVWNLQLLNKVQLCPLVTLWCHVFWRKHAVVLVLCINSYLCTLVECRSPLLAGTRLSALGQKTTSIVEMLELQDCSPTWY